MSIVVFGSLNIDLTTRTPRFPLPGETLTGLTFRMTPGGKGANQASACARLGSATGMVGRIGDDAFGTEMRNSLRRMGVDDAGVIAVPGSTGLAAITVNAAGENTIIVVAGANGTVGDEDIRRLDEALEGARILLLQLELPLVPVAAAAALARRRGMTVILDPAPPGDLPPELYGTVDILTPNEHEAAALVGFAIRGEPDMRRAARELIDRGTREVIVKLGARGLYWTDGTRELRLPALPVMVVDSVAAGDAFNGGLAVALDAGQSRDEALRWGLAAGALAVTRHGAQEAMPQRAEVLELLETPARQGLPAFGGRRSPQ